MIIIRNGELSKAVVHASRVAGIYLKEMSEDGVLEVLERSPGIVSSNKGVKMPMNVFRC